jgi:hypothetical protein
MRLVKLFVVGLLVFSVASFAQIIVKDPDWVEVDAPPPPVFSKTGLIALVMPPYVSMKFGVDPATLSITPDGVVRYVVVATSPSGASTAMYEGIRCSAGEFKTYARQGANGQWVIAKDAEWRELTANNTSKHTLALARQGACDGRATTASSAALIVERLNSGVPPGKNRP